MRENDAKDKMKESNKIPGNRKSESAYRIMVKHANSKTNSNASDGDSTNGKSKSTIKRLTLGSLMLFLFMLLYIPSLLNWFSGNSITRDIMRIGIIEESIQSIGILVRDEELLKSPEVGGRYIAEIGEGEKTPAHARIATVLNSTSDELLQEMEEINAKIVKARMEKAEKVEFFSEDLAKLDKEIGLKVQNLIIACNARSFEELGQYRSEIGKIIEKKAEIVGESSTDSYINSLKQQKEIVQNKLNVNSVQVISNLSGIVSYTIDGCETTLTPESLINLKPKQLSLIVEEYQQKQESNDKAVAGRPLAKIIKGTDIYIAAVMNKESAEKFKVGDKIKLRVNDFSMETTGIISNISEPEAGKLIVAVRVSRGADVLSAARVVNMDFISKTEEGLKVPLSCLREISPDGTIAKIMLIKYNAAATRTVEIVCKDEEYAIIRTPDKEFKKTVTLYDIYILDPDKIEEGDIIEK